MAKVVELAQEELHLRRHRDDEKANQRNHGHDFDKLQQTIARLDADTESLRELHKQEAEQNRHGSRQAG